MVNINQVMDCEMILFMWHNIIYLLFLDSDAHVLYIHVCLS